ncbi:Ankyrin repeat-containing protein ITN1 [Bienertia sinuspersici]
MRQVVKDLVMPQVAEGKDKDGKTPLSLFTEEHKELREAGEEWMRKTAGSCSVVATLISSAVFGFMLKVSRNDTISFTNHIRYSWWYWVFAIFDSLSLITSTSSTLVFLTIMISRYAENDFLYSLPRKLIIGLALLFLSIVSIALTTTFHIVFIQGWPWFGIILLVFITIILFTLELPLMWEIFSSTIGNTSSFQSPTPTLFRTSSNQTRFHN